MTTTGKILKELKSAARQAPLAKLVENMSREEEEQEHHAKDVLSHAGIGCEIHKDRLEFHRRASPYVGRE